MSQPIESLQDARHAHLATSDDIAAWRGPDGFPFVFQGRGSRVLLVDGAAQQPFTKMLLEDAGYVVGTAASSAQAMATLRSHPPDLLIVDTCVSGDSLALTRWVKQESQGFTPILILTDRSDLESRVAGLAAGADDHLAKPVHPVDLLVRVAALIRIRNMTADAERRHVDLVMLNARLEKAVRTDSLTGVLTRQACEDHLRTLVQEARLDGEKRGVLMIDVDHFKEINDRWGHPTGDSALTRIAAVMRSALRPDDMIGRWGGEEFCVLMEGPNPPVNAIAERLRSAVEGMHFLSPGGNHIPMTVSIGAVSRTARGDSDTGAEFIRLADKALYAAKHAGRNCVVRAATDETP